MKFFCSSNPRNDVIKSVIQFSFNKVSETNYYLRRYNFAGCWYVTLRKDIDVQKVIVDKEALFFVYD